MHDLTKQAPFLCAVEAEFKERNSPGLNLHLTARFSDDTLIFGPIKIRVAISRAYLNFKLENCELPLASNLEHTWPTQEKTKQATKSRASKKQTTNNQLSATLSAIPKIAAEENAKANTSSSIETKSENTTTWQHVFWRGNARNPSLIFDSQPTKPYLDGTLLSSEFVGFLEPKQSQYYEIGLELEVPKSGLLIEDGGYFSQYPNKRGLIKILAALKICRHPNRIYERHFKK